MNNLTLIYDPSCSSVDDVKSKVRQHEVSLGFVYDGHIYHKQGGRVNSYAIPSEAMSRCFNRNNNDEIETNIHNLTAMFRNTLDNITDYQLEVLSTNQTIKIPLLLNNIHIFSVSDRTNTNNYFDLCLYTSKKCLCYNKQKVDNFNHGGDKSSSNAFLHDITINKSNQCVFYLSVVGYNLSPLYKFSSQTPSVCIVNHDTRTVYIVPCPLDVVSMGEDGVFAILAKGVVSRDIIEFTILSRPIVRANVNTGDVNSTTTNAINEAANMNVVEIVHEQQVFEDDEYMMDFNTSPTNYPVYSSEPIVVVQDKYSVPVELMGFECYYFGVTISREDERSDVVLPIAGGSTVMADNVLIHAKKPKVQNYASLLKSARLVVIVVGEEMQNSLIDKCQNKVNAVFVVVPDVQFGDVNDIMDSMCINAVTAMAGPCSIVLAQISDDYYFYRGVNWPGFIENAEYGDNVTENMRTLQNIDTSSYLWPFVADMNEVYFKNEKIPLDNIKSIGFETELPMFKDLMYQLQVIMSPEKLKTIQTTILSFIATKEKELRQCPRVKQMIAEGRIKDIKKYIKDQKASYIDIVSLLQNAISFQKSSSKKHDLNRLMRKEIITSNVSEAETKTISNMIDEMCTDMGVISCLIDNELLQSLFIHLRNGTVFNWLNEQDSKYLTNVTNVCSRMSVLDGTTTSALLDNDNNDNSYVCPSLSIKNIYEEERTDIYNSIMFLPLHDKTYEDPYAVSWPIEANDKKVALLRIKMRSIIADAVEHGFSPANKEINYTIIYLYFCILEKLTEFVTPNNDEDSTVRNVSRVIISSILCAASSGQSPLPLYQIVSYNASITVPSNSIWWMYFKLRNLWKYTGWDETVIEKKFNHFIVKCVRKHVVDPVTSQLRQNNSQCKLNENCARWTKKNNELEWLRTTIPAVQSGEMPPPYGGEVTMRGCAIIDKYLRQEPGKSRKEYVLEVCTAIVNKRSRTNWKIYVPPNYAANEHEVIDKRLNLLNLPEIDQFGFKNDMTMFRNVVRILYDNHMNIEKSEELAVAELII